MVDFNDGGWPICLGDDVFGVWRVAHPFLPDVFHFLLTAP
jgi:hypothetical protein